MPQEAVWLAKPNAESISNAIISLLDNKEKLVKMSKFGIEFMSKRPLEHAFNQFAVAVENIMLRSISEE